MREVELNAAQAAAVNYDNGPLLVLAGPGTGKTQLLSSRVVRILTETDASAETILCLTFTESGAANMRERLASLLGPEANKVNIHTYHAFGATVLAAYKNYAENYDRVLDAPIDAVAQFKIIKQIQAGLPAMDIMRTAAVSDILETISAAKSARLTAADLDKVASANITMSTEIATAVEPLMEKIIPRMKADAALPIYRGILEVLAGFTSAEEIAPRVEPIANELTRSLNEVLAQVEAMEKPKLTPLSNWRNANFERDSDGGWRLKDYIANKKLKSLAVIMGRYERSLVEAGLYDFADMIEEAIRALRDDEGFRLSMGERFQHVLLDEFQDTNPSQFELIRLICDYEKPDVMAVGDDDQAIFEFQGANASNLWDFQNYFGAHVVNLETNYRSYSEIIATAKRVSEGIEGSFSRKAGMEKILEAARGLGGKITALNHGPSSSQCVSCPSDPTVSRHEFATSDQEYYWVAERIAELIKSGVRQSEIAVIMPKHKNIAPLLPYLKRHEGVNIAYEKRDDLFLDARIAEIITLAEFVWDLANGRQPEHSLLKILSFPFWGVEPVVALRETRPGGGAAKTASLAHGAGQEKCGLEKLSNSTEVKVRKIAEFLANLVAESFEAPLELCLNYIIGATELNGYRAPFLNYYAKDAESYETFCLYENLLVLREKLKKYLKTENPRLGDLVEFVRDYREARQPLVNTSPYREATDAVQILTAHKSKGLEFDWVFMMSVDAQAWGKAKGNNNMLSLPKNLLMIRHTGITDDEKRRLLFVAMTRARDHLVMTNARADFAEKSPARLEYLAEREEDGKIISPYLPTTEVIYHEEGLEKAAKCGSVATAWSAAYLEPTPEMRALLTARMRGYRLSATDLTTFIDVAYAGPMEFFRRRVLLAPDETSNVNIEYGNLIHKVFEKITNSGISDAEAMEFFQESASRVALDAAERGYLLEKGAAALEVAMREFRGILRAPGARAELSFGGEQLAVGGVPITGKIDHINIDAEARKVEIYDFKTGTYHKENWGSQATLYKYALQLGFYKLLIEAAPSWRGYKVERAHILFVTPDSEGRVYDKVYEFGEERLDGRGLSNRGLSGRGSGGQNLDKRGLGDGGSGDGGLSGLGELVPVVYERATSLDFLDDEELRLEPDPERGLKEIKAFIKLLLDKNSKS